MNISRDSMVIYRSFYDAIKELPEKNQLEILKQIFEFGLDGIESELTGLSKTIWILIKPNLEANRTKWESGCKAKRKQSRSKTEAKPKQERSETEANVYVDVDENEDKDVNENEKLSSKPKAKKKKEKVEFIAPTIEQVQEYFTDKAYPLQLVEKVFNHYNDKEWHKSNGQPVIDWKRTISNNWEDHFQQWRQRQTSNVNRGSSQPQVDPAKIINYGKGNGAVVFSEKYNVYYEPIQNGQPPKEVTDLIYLDQGNHGHYGEYVKWMLMNDKQPMPPEDTRYFPDDFNFEKFISEQKAILANSNQ
jgi:hypothetical protein